MPFPFTLPTTSSFSFSSCLESSSHPSLPLSATAFRGVLRDTFKTHKRLSPQSQSTNLSSVLQAIESYLPYLLTLDAGLSSKSVSGEEIHVVLTSTPNIEWRPTLLSPPVPGREPPRVKLQSLEYELHFVLSTLAYVHTLISRTALKPLYTTTSSSPTPEQRTSYIQSATKSLLLAASIHAHLAVLSSSLPSPAPCADLSTSVFSALSSLALAEATLLAVLKDDPYPAAVAQDRNKNDKEWMIKAPSIPKVRAHLFARLCLAGSEHAARASSLLKAAGKVDEDLLRYVGDLRKVGKAKACRFFGIDAELGGETATGIAWLRGGKTELGISSAANEPKKGLGFSKLKKDWSEKREEKKIEAGNDWGSDAGLAEEGRVLEMLDLKWSKINDTINTQMIPHIGPLLSSMPSGREIHSVKPFVPPELDVRTLEGMRGPPSPSLVAAGEGGDSSDEGGGLSINPIGAFPGTKGDYAGSGSYY
jgi:hypothetical protein